MAKRTRSHLPSRPPPGGGEVFKVARQVERRYLSGDYTGAWVDVIVNPPSAVFDAIQEEAGHVEEAARYAAAVEKADKEKQPRPPTLDPSQRLNARRLRENLLQIIVAWNVADADGQVYDVSLTGLEAVAWPVLLTIVGSWYGGNKLPEASGGESTNGTPARAPIRRSGSSKRNGHAD